jgi:tetratricopeptide (TPR) repeat protein
MKRPLPAALAACLLSLSVASTLRGADAVTLTEQQISIPTYLIGPPEPNPQFYFGGNSQGAQHRIYPYPAYDNLTSQRADKTYTMVTLENEYIRVGILPESGGKIFEAVDKTNHYDFFYKQHVIKPALISLLGAWISGGVEWDIPHHHRATSFLPMQYTTETGADGSKTCWVGELELRDRTRWVVGVTLHPGRSSIEASFRMINRTPLPVSMLCFSNVAVSVNDNYQVIFPPSTQHVTYHGKNQFTTWPLATGRFNNADFGAGTDASWYKNHINSMSMFAWNFSDDFLAGYDHGKEAGTLAIADHNVVPGKKFWTWGNGPGGRAQDTLLTDNDGPYIELMVGAYSDNQPDYSWLAPFETRQWTQYWYPFRDIGGVKNANTDAAVNLEIKDGKARVGFCVTSDRPATTVALTLRGEPLLKETVAMSPGRPYTREIPLPAGADEHDLRASLVADGRELVAYGPLKLQPEALPAPVTPFPAPADIKTNEELYLAGLRNDQFRAPGPSGDLLQPAAMARVDPYWQEALKRDPGDIRVNTALGIEYLRGGRFADAEAHLRKAVERATDRYTTPKDTEPLYYLGLALKMQGKTDEAFPQFAKAAWGGAWKGQSHYEMAEIASLRGDFPQALRYTREALAANADNVRALGLQAALLRHLGRKNEALAAIAAIRKIDPLNVQAAIEFVQVTNDRSELAQIAATLKQFPDTGLEVVTDYLNAGLWDDAAATAGVVSFLFTQDAPANPDPVHNRAALAGYYAGYIAQKSGHPDKAQEAFAAAARAPVAYAFPFQMEMIPVLEAAMAANPNDSHAPYLLGNLLFDSQPQRAIALWEKSAALNADFPEVYRNLALVSARQSTPDRDKALAMLEKAATLGGSAMVFTELDKLYEENGVAPEKRLALFRDHPSVITRDEAIAREINLDLVAGHDDDAIALLKSRLFRAWEGGPRYSLGDSWTDAFIARGRTHLAAKQFADALADFHSAETFPANLQDAVTPFARKSETRYWIGNTYEALGDMAKAKDAWQAAAADEAAPAARVSGPGARAGRGPRPALGGLASGVRVPEAATYYQALALQKLGDSDKANAAFQKLLNAGTQALASAPATGALDKTTDAALRMRIADAHYLAGLGHLGLHHPDQARAQFDLALKASPDHLAARTALADMLPSPASPAQ